MAKFDPIRKGRIRKANVLSNGTKSAVVHIEWKCEWS